MAGKRRLSGLTLSVLIVASLLVPAAPASAFWADGTQCGTRTGAKQVFSVDSRWDIIYPSTPYTLRQFATWSYEAWGTSIESWEGGAALDTDDGSHTFTWTWSSNINSLAKVTCPTPFTKEVRWNVNRIGEMITPPIQTDFIGVAWHESGHIWGLNHSGRYDSGADNPPTMASCSYPSNGWQRGVLSQDDEAGVQFMTDKVGDFRSATANSSFEEGTQWWGKSSQAGTITTSTSGGGEGSPTYGVFKSNGYDSYIQMSTRYIEGWSADVKGQTYAKKNQSNDTGTVLVVGEWREVEYEDSTDPCWDKINGVHERLSVPQVQDNYSNHSYSATCSPSTSWEPCTTAEKDVGTSSSSPTAIDLRISVYNRMVDVSPLEWTDVKVDRARMLIDE